MTIAPAELERRYAALLDELAGLGARFRSKESVWHQRVIDWLLRGGLQDRYLSSYVTTIGRTIYLHRGWDERDLAERYLTLRHERVHLEQFRRYGRVAMALGYLLLPLPVGLAWCRMALEREAYAETLRAAHELGGRPAVEGLKPHVVEQFVSGAYGWMWPFRRRMTRWCDRLLEHLEDETAR